MLREGIPVALVEGVLRLDNGVSSWGRARASEIGTSYDMPKTPCNKRDNIFPATTSSLHVCPARLPSFALCRQTPSCCNIYVCDLVPPARGMLPCQNERYDFPYVSVCLYDGFGCSDPQESTDDCLGAFRRRIQRSFRQRYGGRGRCRSQRRTISVAAGRST